MAPSRPSWKNGGCGARLVRAGAAGRAPPEVAPPNRNPCEPAETPAEPWTPCPRSVCDSVCHAGSRRRRRGSPRACAEQVRAVRAALDVDGAVGREPGQVGARARQVRLDAHLPRRVHLVRVRPARSRDRRARRPGRSGRRPSRCCRRRGRSKSPTWNAAPSTFGSTSGFWATHACGVCGAVFVSWVFHTLVVGRRRSSRPDDPVRHRGGRAPAGGTGSAPSTVAHSRASRRWRP